MTTVKLAKFGHFLSGRSLPQKIVDDAVVDGGGEVALDFTGVAACNQSFVNELFQRLEAKSVPLSAVKLLGMDSKPLRDTVEAEHARYIRITRATS